MFHVKHSALLVLLLLSHSVFAGDVTTKCAWKFFQALNRLEIKGAAPLEITEYRIDKPIDYIFGDNKLELAPLESRFKERVAVFRNPSISRAVLNNVFEQTRFTSDVPSENFASLLKDNTLYTYTIQDKKITFAQTKPGVLRDFASKHALLSSDSKAGPLRMAGEMWKDEKGILHFDPGSGTFKPGAEDLKRAEKFFKEHMGIKDAVPHYFEAPATVVAPVVPSKSIPGKIVGQVKQMELGQLAILNKRRVIGAYKMNVINQDRMKKMAVLEGEKISLIDENNKEVQYKVIRMETMVKEETLFDTVDFKLHGKHQQIKSSKTFNLENENQTVKKNALSENEQAVVMARKSIGNAPLLPVARNRTESVQYALCPINSKGVPGNPAFLVSLDTESTSGLQGKIKGKITQSYTTMVEDLNMNKPKTKQLEQLTDKLQKRFELSGTVSDKDAGIISSLES